VTAKEMEEWLLLYCLSEDSADELPCKILWPREMLADVEFSLFVESHDLTRDSVAMLQRLLDGAGWDIEVNDFLEAYKAVVDSADKDDERF
jgi:hypothetical protein